MKRMADVIKKQRMDIYNQIEERPHETIQVPANPFLYRINYN
jgi:hypothetical protein